MEHSPDRIFGKYDSTNSSISSITLGQMYNKLKKFQYYSYLVEKKDDVFYDSADIVGENLNQLIHLFGLDGDRPLNWLFLKIAIAEYDKIIPGHVFYITSFNYPELNLKESINIFIIKRDAQFFVAFSFYKTLYIVDRHYKLSAPFIKWCNTSTNFKFKVKHVGSHNLYKNPSILLTAVEIWLFTRFSTKLEFGKILDIVKDEPAERFSNKMIYNLYKLVRYIYHTRPIMRDLPIEEIEPLLNHKILMCSKGAYDYGCNIGERYLYLSNLFDGARPNSGPQQVKTIDGREFMYRSYSMKLVEKITDNNLDLLFIHTTHDFIKTLVVSYFSIKHPTYKCSYLSWDTSVNKTISFDTNFINVFLWSIKLDRGSHLTLVMFDPDKESFTFFDPNGTNETSEYFNTFFDQLILRSYPDKDFSYKVSYRERGIQYIELLDTRCWAKDDIDDPSGYCMFFCILILDMWMKNHSRDSSYDFEGVEKCLIALNDSGDIYLTDYIREYFLFIMAMVYKVVHFAHEVVGGQASEMQLEDFDNKHVIRVILNGTGSDYVKVARYYRNFNVVINNGNATTLVSNGMKISEGLNNYMKWKKSSK
jgi:hypothetical protein